MADSFAPDGPPSSGHAQMSPRDETLYHGGDPSPETIALNDDSGRTGTTLLDNISKRTITSNRERKLRYCCYGLHVLLVVIHILLVAMSFSHPEHRVSIAANNTTSPRILSAFLQAFYTVYTALLVLLVQRLAITAAMSKRQKLTAIHDILGAWNGLGAAINSLWCQIRVVSSPSTLFLILGYLTCISSLHVVSPSLIQFEPFNATTTQTVQSTLAWPSPSVDLMTIQWENISPFASMWPLFSLTRGWTKNMLYDVPLTDNPYLGAFVNVTTITAQCGLLSNTSVGTYHFIYSFYDVEVNGLGPISLDVHGPVGTVNWVEWPNLKNVVSPCELCGNYIAIAIATKVDLGNVTSEIFQVDLPVTYYTPEHELGNSSLALYYAICELNATSASKYLSMQNGVISFPETPSNNTQPWTVWTPTDMASLSMIFQNVQGLNPGAIYCNQVSQQCDYITPANIYLNHLLNNQLTPIGVNTTVVSNKPLVVEPQQLENAIAEVVTMFMWLAGESGAQGGFQHDIGESSITSSILIQILNINKIPVLVALLASLMLLTLAVWILYEHAPHVSNYKPLVESPGVLEFLWISTHFSLVQDLMKSSSSPSPDKLRSIGMTADICLIDPYFGCHTDKNINSESHAGSNALHWQEFIEEGQSLTYWWCYALHIIFIMLHIALVMLLAYHPEHHVVISSGSSWVTTLLKVSLQAFYVLYTAGLLFLTQQLAVSKLLGQRILLTGVNDVVNAWPGIGAALYTLWLQKHLITSIWTILGVALYLACISVLHIASTTIMQFTAFNSTFTAFVSSTLAWPDPAVIANGSWHATTQETPPGNILSDINTDGLVNSTIYATLGLPMGNPDFVDATVNTVSFQASCGLLSNLSYNNSSGQLSATGDGLGTQGMAIEGYYAQFMKNQLFNIGTLSSIPPQDQHPLWIYYDQYLIYLITTELELNETINDMPGLSINLTQGSLPLTAYVAACALPTQTAQATLNLQTGKLNSTPAPSPAKWELLSPGPLGSPNLTSEIWTAIATGFAYCPRNGSIEICPPQSNASVAAQYEPLYNLSRTEFEQTLGQTAATIVWMAGKTGAVAGGFDPTNVQSQVTQVIVEWRLNVNTVPVVFASVASLVLLVLAFFLVGIPSKKLRPRSSLTSLGVLETMWASAHSRAIRERMMDIDDPSVDNLRKAGMFEIRLGDIHSSQSVGTEIEAFLE